MCVCCVHYDGVGGGGVAANRFELQYYDDDALGYNRTMRIQTKCTDTHILNKV